MPLNPLRALERDLTSRERVNYETRKFIPYQWLLDLVVEERVRAVVRESNFPAETMDDIITTTLKGAQMIFATLVSIEKLLLFNKFIKYDEFQNRNMDQKLPMTIEQLEKIFGKPELQVERESLKDKIDEPSIERRDDLEQEIFDVEKWASAFEENQYKFIVPSFPQTAAHRSVSDNIRLPFTSSKALGDGFFGEAFLIHVPPPHWTLEEKTKPGHQDLQLVRKQLKPGKGEGYADELRCLRLLGFVDHPNILKVLGFYTYKGTYNFLFPYAKDGDLDELLSEPKRRKQFASDSTFYLALCGLASGLQHLHYFQNSELNLKLIGCHRDLKPSNILVDGPNFILADFGLTTMRDETEDSKKTFQDRDRYFPSPESEDFYSLEKYRIGRKSDIWSLGCIFSVLYAYMTDDGPKGVENLKERRRAARVGYRGILMETKAFHTGAGKPNEGFITWLEEKKQCGTNGEQELLNLVDDMVDVDPDKRIDIKQVLPRLRFATLKRISDSVKDDLANSRYQGTLEFDIEAQTFLSWLVVADQARKEVLQLLEMETLFNEIVDILRKIQHELTKLNERNEEENYPILMPLRHLNDRLLAPFSAAVQSKVHEEAELQTLKTLKSEEQVASLKEQVSGLPDSSTKQSLLTMLSIKQMTDLTVSNSDQTLTLNRDDITIELGSSESETFERGKLCSGSPAAHNIIVETLQYNQNWENKGVGETLFRRMQNILRLPDQATATSAGFRALSCIGFFHDPGHSSFNLVYSYPPRTSASWNRVCSLVELLGRNLLDNKTKTIINAEDRMRLAFDLATVVHKFHKVGWLHKNVSSYNVILFMVDRKPHATEFLQHSDFTLVDLSSPYLIGFSHSRPNSTGEYSTKMTKKLSNKLRAYHHPKYADIDNIYESYKPEYDYYSLGLILLEIGLWTPLHDLVDPTKGRVDAWKHLLSRRVHFLVESMGATYAKAVEVCLDSSLDDRGDEVDRIFQEEVLRRLQDCLIG